MLDGTDAVLHGMPRVVDRDGVIEWCPLRDFGVGGRWKHIGELSKQFAHYVPNQVSLNFLELFYLR